MSLRTIPLSVLDQSVAVTGRTEDASIRETLALAQHCEALGYHRFWVSEHHSHPSIVGSAPEFGLAVQASCSLTMPRSRWLSSFGFSTLLRQAE